MAKSFNPPVRRAQVTRHENTLPLTCVTPLLLLPTLLHLPPTALHPPPTVLPAPRTALVVRDTVPLHPEDLASVVSLRKYFQIVVV